MDHNFLDKQYEIILSSREMKKHVQISDRLLGQEVNLAYKATCVCKDLN